MMKKYKVISVLLIVVLIFDMVFSKCTPSQAEEVMGNPVIEDVFDSFSLQTVTWSCVNFGSYPQGEVVTTAMSQNYTSLDGKLVHEGDLIVDDEVYKKLVEAENEEWDSNGDIVIDGNKYRRISKSSAYSDKLYSPYFFTQYEYSGTYSYFKFERIKWRILNVTDGKALLLADKAVDTKFFNDEYGDNWGTSTIRSWLNGYDASMNSCGIDYTEQNFIDSAFSDLEKEGIQKALISNAGVENDTEDLLFLLSDSQVYGESAREYGYTEYFSTHDAARYCKASMYAKAKRGRVYYSSLSQKDTAGNVPWWLRTKVKTGRIMSVEYDGDLDSTGQSSKNANGVRPAVMLDLGRTDIYTYAGTVTVQNERQGGYRRVIDLDANTKISMDNIDNQYNTGEDEYKLKFNEKIHVVSNTIQDLQTVHLPSRNVESKIELTNIVAVYRTSYNHAYKYILSSAYNDFKLNFFSEMGKNSSSTISSGQNSCSITVKLKEGGTNYVYLQYDDYDDEITSNGQIIGYSYDIELKNLEDIPLTEEEKEEEKEKTATTEKVKIQKQPRFYGIYPNKCEVHSNVDFVNSVVAIRLYRKDSKNGKYKLICTQSEGNENFGIITDKGLKSNKKYWYKISSRLYRSKKWSKKSKAEVYWTCLPKVENVKRNGSTVTWSKVKGADGYMVVEAYHEAAGYNIFSQKLTDYYRKSYFITGTRYTLKHTSNFDGVTVKAYVKHDGRYYIRGTIAKKKKGLKETDYEREVG